MIPFFEFSYHSCLITSISLILTVEGCKIPDTVADDVLHKLRFDYYNIDELFDVDKLLPHLEKRYLITQYDVQQIKDESTQAAKGQLLFNAVKNRGGRSTRLSLLYKSIYDSYEAEFGHGKHHDALGILAKEGMVCLTSTCKFVTQCISGLVLKFGNI